MIQVVITFRIITTITIYVWEKAILDRATSSNNSCAKMVHYVPNCTHRQGFRRVVQHVYAVRVSVQHRVQISGCTWSSCCLHEVFATSGRRLQHCRAARKFFYAQQAQRPLHVSPRVRDFDESAQSVWCPSIYSSHIIYKHSVFLATLDPGFESSRFSKQIPLPRLHPFYTVVVERPYFVRKSSCSLSAFSPFVAVAKGRMSACRAV